MQKYSKGAASYEKNADLFAGLDFSASDHRATPPLRTKF
jgi:hypothetical protein